MDAYWAAKRALFAWPGLRSAVVNIDNAHGAALAAELGNSTLDLWTCASREAVNPTARLQARNIRVTDSGMAFEVHEAGQQQTVHSPVPGTYNVANLLGVIAALRSQGTPLAQAAAGLRAIAHQPHWWQPAALTPAIAVTEVSGRGVGMEAALEFIKAEHGSIQIRFTDDCKGAPFRHFETVILLPATVCEHVDGLHADGANGSRLAPLANPAATAGTDPTTAAGSRA
jgi:hypothetical protein